VNWAFDINLVADRDFLTHRFLKQKPRSIFGRSSFIKTAGAELMSFVVAKLLRENEPVARVIRDAKCS
jgi:hypothetical protein